mmetsp:Transcript_2214/g.8125  ORF Transcript_2214/g.8125 Transcript_2214/m.8125 type:complete len:147 (-) Transcript_2214:13-453(-)
MLHDHTHINQSIQHQIIISKITTTTIERRIEHIQRESACVVGNKFEVSSVQKGKTSDDCMLVEESSKIFGCLLERQKLSSVVHMQIGEGIAATISSLLCRKIKQHDDSLILLSMVVVSFHFSHYFHLLHQSRTHTHTLNILYIPKG